MTTFPHPSPRDEPAAFARAFADAVAAGIPRWFHRGDVEVKEIRLVPTGDDFGVEVLFRTDRWPEAVYGLRCENICREAASEMAAAEALGAETGDALGPSVTVMLANLDELIHVSRTGLPRPTGDVTWI